MSGELNKNSPLELEKLYQFVGRSAIRVEDDELAIWSAWMSTIKQALHEAETKQNDVKITINDLKF